MIRAFVCVTLLSAALGSNVETPPVTSTTPEMKLRLNMNGKVHDIGAVSPGNLNEKLAQTLAKIPDNPIKKLAGEVENATNDAANKVQTAPAVKTVHDRREILKTETDKQDPKSWVTREGSQCGLYMTQAIVYLLGLADKSKLPTKASFTDAAAGHYAEIFQLTKLLKATSHQERKEILTDVGIRDYRDDNTGLLAQSWWGYPTVKRSIEANKLTMNGHGMVQPTLTEYWPKESACDSNVVAWAVHSGSQERGHWTGLVRSSNDPTCQWIKVCSLGGVSMLDSTKAKSSLTFATSIFPLTLKDGAKPPIFETPVTKTTNPVGQEREPLKIPGDDAAVKTAATEGKGTTTVVPKPSDASVKPTDPAPSTAPNPKPVVPAATAET